MDRKIVIYIYMYIYETYRARENVDYMTIKRKVHIKLGKRVF